MNSQRNCPSPVIHRDVQILVEIQVIDMFPVVCTRIGSAIGVIISSRDKAEQLVFVPKIVEHVPRVDDTSQALVYLHTLRLDLANILSPPPGKGLGKKWWNSFQTG